MKRGKRALRWQDVLILSPNRKAQATIRRYYDKWRRENGIPKRCDNTICHYHSGLLVWNNKPLTLILDHADGNRFHNLPSNIRYLCPNCNSQLSTCGGANRGRVEMTTDNGFILKNRDGTKIAAATGRMNGKSALIGVGRAVIDRAKKSGA